MRIDLNRLVAFSRLYKSQSLLLAGKSLHVTPSAIAQSTRKLEKELGTQLFARIGKKYVPSKSAHELFRVVDPFLQEVEAHFSSVKKSKEELTGTLHLGAPVEYGKTHLLPAIAALRKRHPGLSFVVTLSEPSKLLPMLLANRLDFAICDSGSYLDEFSQISTRSLHEEELVLACSSKFYAEFVREDHSAKHLLTLEHIPYVTGARESVSKWYRHHFDQELTFRAALAIDNVHAVVESIRTHLGLGVVPSRLIDREVRLGQVRVIQTKRSPLRNEILLVQLKGRIPTRAEKAIISAIRGS